MSVCPENSIYLTGACLNARRLLAALPFLAFGFDCANEDAPSIFFSAVFVKKNFALCLRYSIDILIGSSLCRSWGELTGCGDASLA